MSDLELQRPCRRGDKQGQVHLIQEWLCLQGWHVKIDGDFGPATEAAVKEFQTQRQLPASGVVDGATFDRLVASMRAALAPLAPQGRSLGQLVVAYAQQHLQQHPREIGGQNKGPWVDYIWMDTRDGMGVVCRVCLLLPEAGMPKPWGVAPDCALVLVRLSYRFREGEGEVSARAFCNGSHEDHARQLLSGASDLH